MRPTESLAGLLLTDSSPKEIQSLLWAKQCSKDMLANKTDFKYPFKTSSLVCPFCQNTLDGESSQHEGEEKRKPWEVALTHLLHEEKNPACPTHKLRGLPQGHSIEKIILCHQMSALALRRASGNSDLLHEDPVIPKLHTYWDEEKQAEYRAALQEELTSYCPPIDPHFLEENPEIGQEPKPWEALPEGEVQRILPCWNITNPEQDWKKILHTLPQWSQTNPNDPEAPQIHGWVTQENEQGETHTLCGYVLNDTEEECLPDVYPVPIFRVLGPDGVLQENNTNPVPYLEVEVLCGPPTEPTHWKEAITVQVLKKQEKLRRKQKVQEEIERLPKERIWEGFQNPHLPGHYPEKDRPQEPQQTLKGYRPGSDIKKWWLPGIGNPHAKIWIIGLYPSNEEIRRRGGPKILSGPSGEELFRLVRESGLNLKTDVFFENIVKRYLPPKSKISQELKLEQTWLLKKQLAFYNPERVICLGADVYREIAGTKSFQDFRGTWTEATYPRHLKSGETPWVGRVSGTFHPAGVLRPEGRHNLELFRHDMVELLLDKTPTDVHPSIKELKTLPDVQLWVEKEIEWLDELNKENKKVIYALDTESYSLDAQVDELASLQIAKAILQNPKNNDITLPIAEVPKHCDILLFQENSEPETYDHEVFEHIAQEDAGDLQQLALFDSETPSEPTPEVKKVTRKPVITIVNSEEEKRTLLQTHTEKRKHRDLTIFTPYKKHPHLKGKEKEVGRLLSVLSTHPSVYGYAITNANHDRIRVEKELGWDLTLPKNHGGLPYPLDTVLLEHILDENGDLGLKACLNKHFNWPRQDALLEDYSRKNELAKIKTLISDKTRQSEWSLYPWSLLKPYAGKDAFGTAALLAKQLQDLKAQTLRHQNDRVESQNPNTLYKAFHISCGAINGTYEMHKMGMPVGEKGMKVLKELTAFYAKHETRMIEQYQDAVFKLTGLKNANPASPEELSYVLFNENSPLKKQGVEPWKESGRNGRLWSEIPREERPNCTASTDAESLEIIASNCQNPEIQQFLLRLSETKTILTIRSSFLPDLTSTKGIIGRINKKTLCMHTTYTPTLDTNRCRSVPNLSTFPKEETAQVEKILGEAPPHKIREIIQAPEGAYLLNRDWTTAEVLGVGYLSQDKNMLGIISRMNKGMDFHCKLALKTYQKIPETFALLEKHPHPPEDWLQNTFEETQQKALRSFWKEHWAQGTPASLSEEETHRITKKLFKQERSNIKPVTFGVPYGREAPAIMKALNREYYVNDTRDSQGKLLSIALEEAQAMIDSYKSEFPQAWGYLVEQSQLAKTQGILRDHWGYIRHFPQGMKEGDLVRKAYNYQIQHIVAVLMNQAMNDWTQLRKAHCLKSYAYATLYDNIGWVVFEDELQKVWDLSMEVMTEKRPVGPAEGSLPILHSWHIPTEGEISLAWDGEAISPQSLGIEPHPEKNLTGLENLTF
jgi:uracil-DNA glycosylase family 4